MSSPENRRSSPLARESAKILAATVRRASSALATTLTARTCAIAATLLFVFSATAAAQQPRRIFISVDMEGIGGVGTPAMTSAGGKDYDLARRLMTDEVNAVVAAIFESGPATVLVNDSHGDMQNLLHTELDPRVTYIQGAVKPVGMVAGLDSTFDAAFFIGYHARAGTPDAFLAHTGTGSVKGLWLDDREVGEGGLNAAYAAALGVPVLLASGDSAFVAQFGQNVGAELVTTKWAVTDVSAKLIHPKVVHERLVAAAKRALARSGAAGAAKQLDVGKPVRVRMRFSDTALPQILEAIPGVKRVDGYTVGFTAASMAEAYPIIRLMYRFVRI